MEAALADAVAGEPRDLLEEIEISPFQRWRQYGVWPSRQLAQALVLIAAVMHLWEIEDVLVTYSENFERNCFNLIIKGSLQHDEFSRKGGYDLDAEDFHANEFIVFNTTDAQTQLVNVVNNYFKLSRETVDFITVANASDPTNTVPYPRLRLVTAGENATDEWTEVRSLVDLGPLSPAQPAAQVSEFIHRLQKMELFLTLQSENPKQYYLTHDVCVLWQYRFSYSRERGAGPFFATIRQHSEQQCAHRPSSASSVPIMWLHGWLVFASCLHLALALGRVLRGISVIQTLRAIYEHHDDLQTAETAAAAREGRRAPSRHRMHSRLRRTRAASMLGIGETEEEGEGQGDTSEASESDDGTESESGRSASPGGSGDAQRGGAGERRGSTDSEASSFGATVTWDEIWWRDKLTIINLWNLISIAADLCLLVYTSAQMSELLGGQAILYSEEEHGWAAGSIKVLLGLGCAFHLLSLLEYAEYSLVDYLFIQVNRTARSEVAKIIVGVAPITMAYILFGVVLYGGKVSRFGSVRNTAITLFALCLGDEMWATFMDVEQFSDIPVAITLMYLLSFVMIHLYVVGMSILAVVEEAFITQGLWLLEVDTEDPSPDAKRAAVNAAANVLSASAEWRAHSAWGSQSAWGSTDDYASSVGTTEMDEPFLYGRSQVSRSQSTVVSPVSSQIGRSGPSGMMRRELWHELQRTYTPPPRPPRHHARQASGVALTVSPSTARMLQGASWSGRSRSGSASSSRR